MKRQILILNIFLLLITLIACEDVVEVKLSEETVSLLAIEAKITTDQEPFVHLYRAVKVDSDEPYPGISGTKVILSDNSYPPKTIRLVEDTAKAGLYIVPENESYLGVPGREYTITIQTGEVTLTASDQLFPVEAIDFIRVRPSLRGDKQFLGVFTYGNEPEGIGNYYKWDIYINDTLLYEAENIAIASDEFVDGNYVNGLEIFTDFHDPNDPSERKLKFGDTVYVKQTSISQFAYLYYYQLFQQSTTGGLFSVPPANISGNFSSSDGKTVLGLFTAHAVSKSNKVIIDESIEGELND